MNKMKVLIADSTASLRQFIKYALESHFPQMTTEMANSGKNIQQRMESTRYDLVLYEKEMPLLDGFTLLEWLRRHESLKATPLILMSAGTEEESLKRAVQLGADAYLLKPFKMDGLVGKVAAIVNRPLRRKMERHRADGAFSLRTSSQNFSGSLQEMAFDGLSGIIETQERLPQILEKVEAGVELQNRQRLEGIAGVITGLEAVEAIPDIKHIRVAVKFISDLPFETKRDLEALLSSQTT
ncbi:MAG: response regulator [Nitrospirae bacterium]|nr:response regulator [Nitrospirota bacterium]